MTAVSLFQSPSSLRAAARPSALQIWLCRIHTRRALAALHPDQMRDVGLEPWQVRAEIRKPFWRG
ncbi:MULTISPECIES: DUF1127 domain-containing protein [Methylobacterium]|jgi:uncharacterized protein YjiS (DUF1127 family)|uniref:Translation initiation factor IF-2 n=1 Tax=Methylobacterium longum TaxID=767694 RepID=A0ABT8AXF3_9HYPH|nr:MULTISPECIES: translation initiation factor IF-2 [Methylobacterium]MCJ2102646.1 translation initiation factor IF-2 [Methylobacterium sp. E-046]MDN3574425.1 translation initiation factor IF-2 [Methylobacterium longum]GJE10275.1 hypothetical protein FOHLNKBM_1308 [Methylobacterium longum]